MKRTPLVIVLTCLLPVLSFSQPLGRENIGKGWGFTLDGGQQRTVDVPHDWGVEGPFDLAYPGETGKLAWWGKATYSKAITVSAKDISSGRRILLDVDGAMANAKVYCNSSFAGEWPYGYASFQVDLTPFVKEGENIVEIRLDNKDDSSRWYPGGGLYRRVWLTKVDPVGIAHWGTFVTTPEVSPEKATVKIATTFRNSSAPSGGTVRTIIYRNGSPVTRIEDFLEEIKDGEVLEQSVTLNNPVLWDTDNPEMYCAVTTVETPSGYKDEVATPFGIRTVEFTPEGFFLNGRKSFLKGVCLHHDAGGLGAAWSDQAWIRRLSMLRLMGCNAIRTSHNPPAPEFLDLCDRMGFLVMDELTDTWTVPKRPNGYAVLFEEWSEKDLTSLILRDRNHPSVVLWSIGNEVAEQGIPEKWHLGQELTDICHRLDPTRLTCSGCDNLWASTQPWHEVMDVYGYNYKPHSYEKFHLDNPTQPYLGSETASCISTRGFYVFPVEDDKDKGRADWQVSSYDLYAPGWASSPEYEWAFEDVNPSLAGEFVWTGFDYLGEPTPYNADRTILTNYHDAKQKAQAEEELRAIAEKIPPSRSSYFGIIDLAGFPKDRYFQYQSRWRNDLPMAHILPHWNWEGREGEITPVHVYTTGDSAELFINGRSQGTRKMEKGQYRLRWDDVRYEKGEVKVIAYKDGRKWAEDKVVTASKPRRIVLRKEKGYGPFVQLRCESDPLLEKITKDLVEDPYDAIFIDVEIQGKRKVFAPTACPDLEVIIKGPAELLYTDAGDPTCLIPFRSTSFKAFNGLSSIALRATGKGKVKVIVKGKGLRKGKLSFKVE